MTQTISSYYNANNTTNRQVRWDGRNQHMPRPVKTYVKALSDDTIQELAKDLTFSDTRSFSRRIPNSDWELSVTLTAQLNHYFIEEVLVAKARPCNT